MIKLSNGQASAFATPLISNLFNDPNRQFPMADAFKVLDLVTIIQARLKNYFEKQKELIEGNGGQISETGQITYDTPENQAKAMAEIAKLNAIELEYPGNKIVPLPGWPNLTLSEASILKPIISRNGHENISGENLKVVPDPDGD